MPESLGERRTVRRVVAKPSKINLTFLTTAIAEQPFRLQTPLRTQRLLLRSFILADAPAVTRLAGEYDIAAMTLTIPHPYPDNLAREWIDTHAIAFRSGTEVNFAMVLRQENELCGRLIQEIQKWSLRK